MEPSPSESRMRTCLALAVHLYTASGLVAAGIAAAAIQAAELRLAFLAMFAAVLIDATDGTFARAVDVRRHTPWVNGRKLDDIVDYLNYTFIPIYLVWLSDWIPEPKWLWCSVPLICSAYAFVHEGAKEEDRGFFRGFPSYWNIVVFYFAVLDSEQTRGLVLPTLLILSLLCIAPIRFVYPNRPPCWQPFFVGGASLWAGLLLLMLAVFPDIPRWLLVLSLSYPIAYTGASFYLDWMDRQGRISAPRGN